MSVPKVYAAISAVAAEPAKKGIGKNQTNAQDQYQFRGIDDVYKQLSPALAAHKLCILPRVLERISMDRAGTDGGPLVSVSVRTAFDLVSAEDGSVHVIEAYGEALDSGDKATSKAMTAAFKYAVFEAFCVPVIGLEDADASSHRIRKSDHVLEPVQGWEQWVRDIGEVVRVCETGEALDRFQNTNRALFKTISRERPDLYTEIGTIIRTRRDVLEQLPIVPAQQRSRKNAAKNGTTGAAAAKQPNAAKSGQGAAKADNARPIGEAAKSVILTSGARP